MAMVGSGDALGEDWEVCRTLELEGILELRLSVVRRCFDVVWRARRLGHGLFFVSGFRHFFFSENDLRWNISKLTMTIAALVSTPYSLRAN